MKLGGCAPAWWYSRSGGAGGGGGGEAGQHRVGDTLGVKGLSPEPGLRVSHCK